MLCLIVLRGMDGWVVISFLVGDTCWCRYYLLVPPRQIMSKRDEGECCVVLMSCGKVKKERKERRRKQKKR